MPRSIAQWAAAFGEAGAHDGMRLTDQECQELARFFSHVDQHRFVPPGENAWSCPSCRHTNLLIWKICHGCWKWTRLETGATRPVHFFSEQCECPDCRATRIERDAIFSPLDRGPLEPEK